MKKHVLAALFAILAASVLIGLAACGGDGSAGTPIVMQGTMTKGSAIIGGVRFEDSAASITADDNPRTSAFLDDGMTVKLKGRVNDDRLTGEADIIEVENEVRGPVTSVGTDSFVVFGQTVYVDGSTYLDGGITFSGGVLGGLVATERVEVHGSRNAAGNILASRVEKLGAGADDEVRGVVTAKTALVSFQIEGGTTYTYDGSTVIVGGADFNIGDLVEVHLNVTNKATRIELEDAEDSGFDPAEGSEIEVEGFVSGYPPVSPDTSFLVGAQAVAIDVGTRFEAGVIADLANDVRVEAEGHAVTGGVLSADKIKFKDTIRIEANADKEKEPDAFGLNVLVTSLTDDNVGVGSIKTGDGLKIRGFLNNDGLTVTATRIDGIAPVTGNKFILQGVAVNPSSTGYTYTVAGITVNYTGATEIEDEDAAGSTVLTLAQFRDKITGGRTVVKAKGSFSAGTFTANKVEIE